MFEIKYRDAMGRIGELKAKNKKAETPILLPVINPKALVIPPQELSKMGFQGIIVNSYLIWKNLDLRERAIKHGVHSILGFKGLIMTDSGSYQLYKYGEIGIGPRKIVEFQREIRSDIGVMLDVPSPPDVTHEQARKDLEETIKRGKSSIGLKGEMLLAGTIQGSIYPDLREMGAREMSKLKFDLYPIGGMVHLLEDYRFSELVKALMHSKKFLPCNKPVHLFGCGHPMIFALAVAMGCDIFDSAAYALYAKDERYIMPNGTFRLQGMAEFPCNCEVCSSFTPMEVRKMKKDEREILLAKHNLYASISEIKRIKQSIVDGSLWELVEMRARSHPKLLEGLRTFLGYDFIEPFDPVTKRSAFFFSGPESIRRPEVLRHLKRLNEIEYRANNLVLLPEKEKPYSKSYGITSSAEYHICIASPIFGPIPLEIEETYPLGQHEAPEMSVKNTERFIKQYSEKFEKIYVHEDLKLSIEGERFKDHRKFTGKKNEIVKARAMADYQIGKGAGKALFDKVDIVKAKTGRIRRIHSGNELLAVIRASDGFLVLSLAGAKRLLKMQFPKNRVIVGKEASEFVKKGKSVFAKFVLGCDKEIRPYQEVIVVDEDDALLATGKAILNATEMLAFNRGVAVKIRHKTA